ncbi:hypothetical protein HaLaN_16742 [Haematococcus lacustris]|uniref:Uncharacterized protein n=1 Tax=Haematococcus lacustris TaxID=44745 RepID=A0A699ZJJ1_HAELA|nr:hypothetical protein HaLaN_16742 [Haematococcus lacustris]
MDDDSIHRITSDRVAVLPSPSSPQLAPLALDLVLGMENTLQMVMQHQDMVWKCPFWNDGNLVQGLADGYRTLLALFGHAIEVLATPSVAERLLSCLTLVLTAMLPQDLCLALSGGVTNTVPGLDLALEKDRHAMGVALSKLQPEQVWTWQALAAGTPAEATLQGLLPALASLFQVQGLVTPIAPGWRHQHLTLALGEWQES